MKKFFRDLFIAVAVSVIVSFCSDAGSCREKVFLSALHIDESLASWDAYPILRYIVMICAPGVIFGIFMATIYFYKDTVYENPDKPKAPVYTPKQFAGAIVAGLRRGKTAKTTEEQAYEEFILMPLVTVVLSLLMTMAVMFGIHDIVKIYFKWVLCRAVVFIGAWGLCFYLFYKVYEGIMNQPYVPRSQVKVKKHQLMAVFVLGMLFIFIVLGDCRYTKLKAFDEQEYFYIVAPCTLPKNIGESCQNEAVVYLTKETSVIDAAQIELTKEGKYKLTVDLNKQRIVSPPAVNLERVPVNYVRRGEDNLVIELSR